MRRANALLSRGDSAVESGGSNAGEGSFGLQMRLNLDGSSSDDGQFAGLASEGFDWEETSAAGNDAPADVVCRICEQSVPQTKLDQHSVHCALVRESNFNIAKHEDELANLHSEIEQAYPSPSTNEGAESLDPEELAEQERIFKFWTGVNDLIERTVGIFKAEETYSFEHELRNLKLPPDIRDAPGFLERALTHMNAKINCLQTRERHLAQRLEVYDPAIHAMGVPSVAASADAVIGTEVRDTMAGLPNSGRPFAGALSSPTGSAGDIAAVPTIDDFLVIKKLSGGAFGRVYLAKKKTTGDYFAIKVLNKADLFRKNQTNRIIMERDIMAKLDNPFIAKLFYSFQSIDYLYLVLEYLNGGDLYALLQTVGTFTEKWARIYVAELVCAVEHLHKLGIVHRDIKPENLLIDQDGHLKLTDFGLSFEAFHQGRGRANQANNPGNLVGTPDFIAPESILQKESGAASDWWAVGVTTYQLLCGDTPFFHEDPVAMFEKIVRRDIKWPPNLSVEAKSLIDGLLTLDPEKRLGSNGVEEVKSHAFFNGINWDELAESKANYVPATQPIEEISNTVMGKHSIETPLSAIGRANQTVEDQQPVPEVFSDFTYTNFQLLQKQNQVAIQKSAASKWTVSIPETSVADEAHAGSAKTEKMKCLIAEDNPVIQKLACALLRQLGIVVDSAVNGKEALEKAQNKVYSAILMDIMMPVMDGIEATRRIRAETANKDTPILAFTAMGDPAEHMKDKGMFNNFLSKPFTKPDLYAVLKTCLKENSHMLKEIQSRDGANSKAKPIGASKDVPSEGKALEAPSLVSRREKRETWGNAK